MEKIYAGLIQERADLVAEGKRIFEKAEAESRVLSAEEAARDDEINARIGQLDAEIVRHEANRERQRTQAAAPRIEGMRNRAEDDPKRGFCDIAEFSLAVKGACTSGGKVDERLMLAAAPDNFFKETGSDEGRMVPPAFREEIWEIAMGEDSLIEECNAEPTDKSAVEFLKDESTPWGATGIQAKWRGEDTKMEGSKFATKASLMRLQDLYVFVNVTDDLLDDAPRLANRLIKKSGEAIKYKQNLAIPNGSGVGEPLGYMKSGAVVSVPKETSQAADTVVAANVAKMYARMINPVRATWKINQDVLPQLMTMTLGQQPIWTPPSSGFQNAPGGFLFGRPVQFLEAAETVGDKGDIQFVNLTDGYYAITNTGGVKFASSIHLYFDYGLQSFRWTIRMNGQPFLSAPVSPKNGSNTRSHFVTLEARA
jgi:HK97 family phage major capsid protein